MRPTRAVLIFAIVSLFGLQYLAWKSLHANGGRAEPILTSEIASALRPDGHAGFATAQGAARVHIQLPLSDTHDAMAMNAGRSQSPGEAPKLKETSAQKPVSEQQIFVSIASYRCSGPTAAYPVRIFCSRRSLACSPSSAGTWSAPSRSRLP